LEEIKIKVFSPNLRVSMSWLTTIEELTKLLKMPQKPKDLRKSKLLKIEKNMNKKRRTKSIWQTLRNSDLNISKHLLTIEQRQLMNLGLHTWANIF